MARPHWLGTLQRAHEELRSEPDIKHLVQGVAFSVGQATGCGDTDALASAIWLKFWEELPRIAAKHETAQHSGGWRRYLVRLARQAAYKRAAEENGPRDHVSRLPKNDAG